MNGSPARAGIDHIINAGNALGSPARAGIDLGLRQCILDGHGFPRTRGDRPFKTPGKSR